MTWWQVRGWVWGVALRSHPPPTPPTLPPGGREDTLVEMSFYVPRDNDDFKCAGGAAAGWARAEALALWATLMPSSGALAWLPAKHRATSGAPWGAPTRPRQGINLPLAAPRRGEEPEAADGEEGDAPAGPVDPPSKVLFELVSQFTDAGAAA